MSIAHLLNRSLEHWRSVEAPTGTGGYETTWIQLDTVGARVSQPTATERVAADQGEARLTHAIYLEPDEGVRRGDELRDGDTGEVFEIVATIAPSKDKYLRADAHLTQHEED